jgi:hypothetical protein
MASSYSVANFYTCLPTIQCSQITSYSALFQGGSNFVCCQTNGCNSPINIIPILTTTPINWSTQTSNNNNNNNNNNGNTINCYQSNNDIFLLVQCTGTCFVNYNNFLKFFEFFFREF